MGFYQLVLLLTLLATSYALARKKPIKRNVSFAIRDGQIEDLKTKTLFNAITSGYYNIIARDMFISKHILAMYWQWHCS